VALVAALEGHLTQRHEAMRRYEHAQHEAILARQSAAERQRIAEQQAAAQAVQEVRRRFAANPSIAET
jgi:hypothetical protein